MEQKTRVLVWNEFRHERENEEVRRIYPDGLHKAIGASFDERFEVSYATLDEPEHGLTEERLAQTDVLIWWGHCAHDDVDDRIVLRVRDRVWQGMGLIVLHSGHFSKVFKLLMGTSCDLKWREAGEKERVWVISPGHPIAEGIGEYFEIPHEEMYGEHFDIPEPDQLVFASWFEGGELFRSGCCFNRGQGKIFYFRPGHETFPTYYQDEVRRIIANAALWAAPTKREKPAYGNAKPLETIRSTVQGGV
ncbi:ThuA domain-containing protein [Paenibacillus sp. LHD-117]|uniref:ThuA domain-containing protein n=1 Tax=Paenibacillus sp. LHD-117 TaxID=3071412 RepID=UPI0027E0159C|nr:ThuA domain-containing protein [Paenibacillus sp. LHD-117]MDQ6419538.1 ThuA domain-containing protein [Paenibacillus sp. LHD-117]